MKHCHTVLSFTLVSSVLAGVEIEGASESSGESSLNRLSLNAYELACRFLVTWFSSDSISVITLSVDALFSVTADLLIDFAALFAATVAFFCATSTKKSLPFHFLQQQKSIACAQVFGHVKPCLIFDHEVYYSEYHIV